MNLNKKQAEFAIVYINNPDMTLGDIADEIKVHRNTITNWMQNKEFVETLYETYMKSFGAKLPSVLQAMYKEAINGNVQAGRLILEHSGKLIRNVEVKSESPYERFLSQKQLPVQEAIIVEEIEETLEPKKIALRKKEKLNQQKKESKELMLRAKKVSLKPLGRGRHTRTEKSNWLKRLEALEAKSLPTD